jgi:hypothetical protein
MAVCSRCGTALIATARFCAACGSPVALNTTPRPPTQPMSASNQVAAAPAPSPGPAPTAPVPVPDPFARTVMGDPNAVQATSEPRMPTAPLAQIAIAPARPNPVSPMASSVMNTPGDPARKPAAATPWNVPASAANPYAPTRPPPPVAPVAPVQAAPAAPPTPSPGTMVLVHWSDGNRYPGTVLQAAGGQVLIAFPNGQQQWIDMKFVSSGT